MINGTFKISIPEKYIISDPDINGNETNPYFLTIADRYATNCLKRGWKLWNESDRLFAEVKRLRVDEFELIMMFEGEIEWYNPFIKVSEVDIDSEIPEGLPNRIYKVQIGTESDIDPETNEEYQIPIYEDNVHTWRSWRDQSHPLGEPINGFYYFMSATFGKTLTGSELFIIHNSPYCELVNEIPYDIPN